MPVRSSALHDHRRQKGVTLPLVVVSIVSLFAMAALAIDVASLYLARSEAQRAADAAALAAARAFINSGVTSDPGVPASQSVAVALAQQQVDAALLQNNIAGRPGQLIGPVGTNPSFDFTAPENPRVTVVVGQTGLPTFFSHIWSRAPISVTATATAEAFNPSGTSASPPILAQCLKPFIVPNLDPGQPSGPGFDPFIDTAGAFVHPGRVQPYGTGFAGEEVIFKAVCPRSVGSVAGCPNRNPPRASNSPLGPVPCLPAGKLCLDFVPAALPPPATSYSCPSCGGGAATQFENDIACCNPTAMACNSATQVSVLGGPDFRADLMVNPVGVGGPMSNGLQCLIHKANPGDQDLLDPTGFPTVGGTPFRFIAGNNNPLAQPPNPIVPGLDRITTSDSIITLLIYDGAPIATGPPTATVNVVGYMQVFVTDENGPIGQFTGVIMNIVGCGTSSGSGTPITGGGVTPIPVRLIH